MPRDEKVAYRFVATRQSLDAAWKKENMIQTQGPAVLKWTPIQEGRFHLRSRKPGETLRSYMRRLYRHLKGGKLTRKTNHVKRVLKLARDERRKLEKQPAARTCEEMTWSTTVTGRLGEPHAAARRR